MRSASRGSLKPVVAAARARQGRLSRLVRSASDNSFGVYLSHVVFLDLLATYSLGLPRPLTVLTAVAVSLTGATLVTIAAARTPLSRWLVGRARRPLRGGPPPAGRGTVLPGRLPRGPEADHQVGLSCQFPGRRLSLFRWSQQLPGCVRASSQGRPECWPEW